MSEFIIRELARTLDDWGMRGAAVLFALLLPMALVVVADRLVRSKR